MFHKKILFAFHINSMCYLPILYHLWNVLEICQNCFYISDHSAKTTQNNDFPILNQLCIITILTEYAPKYSCSFVNKTMCFCSCWWMSFAGIGSDSGIFVSRSTDSQIDSFVAPKSKVHCGCWSFWQKAIPQTVFFSHEGPLHRWGKATLYLHKIQCKDAMLDKI